MAICSRSSLAPFGKQRRATQNAAKRCSAGGALINTGGCCRSGLRDALIRLHTSPLCLQEPFGPSGKVVSAARERRGLITAISRNVLSHFIREIPPTSQAPA